MTVDDFAEMPMTIIPKYLNRAAAAAYVQSIYGFRCSKRHLANLAVNGGGPAFHKAKRDPLYDVRDLDAWAAKQIGPGVFSTLEHRLGRQTAAA